MASEYVKKAAYTRMQRTHPYGAGPYKGGYVDKRHAGELKSRQFGPGPNPKVGPENRLISGIR